MTKKNSNTLLYSVILVLFVLLFLFSGSPTHVEKQLTDVSAEQTISDADIIQKLGLQPYDELQREVADLQGKVNDTTDILLLKKQGKTVHVQLVKATTTDIPPIELTLDATDSYDFNSTFSKLDALTQSNLGSVVLSANSKWTESNYASAKFPSLLGWNADFSEKFKTLRNQKITQNTTQVAANTTKSVHFFLWSTLEYMKDVQQNVLHYTITKNDAKYTVASAFNTFDHKTPRIEHVNDSTQQINTFKENLKNTSEPQFTFTQSDDLLTLTTTTESFSIPLRSGNAASIKTIGKVSPETEALVTKALTPILNNLTKKDATITSWKQKQYNNTMFPKALDLSIRDSRWAQFVTKNKAEDVFDFFIETIAFQLDEVPQNTLTLKANTISNQTTSQLASVGNALMTRLFFILGVIASLFLIVREQFPDLFTKEKTSEATEVVTEKVVTATKEEVQPIAKATKTDEEILQQKIQSIQSLQEVSKLPWKSAIEKELKFLIENNVAVNKIAAAKNAKGDAFLNDLKDIFPAQISELVSKKEDAALWNEFSAIKEKSDLKKFLKKHKGLPKTLPNLLALGLQYEAFDSAETFVKALKTLQQAEKFPKETTVLLQLKEKYPNNTIDESIHFIEKSNASLINGAKTATTIPELLPYLVAWTKAFRSENPKWQSAIDKIANKQQAIQNESNTTKKLGHIQELYHILTNKNEDVLQDLLTQFSTETKRIQEASQQQIETAQKTAEQSIANIKAQAKEAYEALETSKKTSDNNNKLAEKYFANLYDPYIKEFQNKTKDWDHAELTKRLAFIAFNAMDLAKFVNDNWSADAQTEGNIRRILRRESLREVPKENYNPNTATSYLNTIVAFLHKNGVKEVEHLIDGIDINEELKGLH
ncbi:MAG: hypothetical protein AAF611_06615 [Bacteroidota bacterium]